ncbi:MAG: methyltransferase domain-containing protein [Nitrospira sp.]|nr:methyltransferase domain-containing protein [Nitrospira sp.]
MNNKLQEHSRLMRALLAMGKVRLAWACRRLHCPVPASALVLEVGSGGSPYFRANVLIDAYAETRERHWAPFITDRPSVLGMGEALPFRDKSFDFVIASHVLEHSSDPENFLRELQRVAKAGYIETPDAFMERINPYWDHRSEVTVRDGVLEVRKKSSWCPDPDLVELYEERAKGLIAGSVIPSNPFTFHTRFYWTDQIPFRVVNPEVDASWAPPEMTHTTQLQVSLRAKLGRWGLSTARALLSQRQRNSKIQLMDLLQCPACKSTELKHGDSAVDCIGCGKQYDVIAGVPRMSVEP